MQQSLSKGYLVFVGLFWSLYGLAVLIKPEILTLVATLGQENWVAAVEVRAMYGGLEFALGVFTFLGLLSPQHYQRPAITLNVLVLSALALTRIAGMLLDGPGASAFAMSFGGEDIPAGYNAGALFFFELPFAVIGIWLLRSK